MNLKIASWMMVGATAVGVTACSGGGGGSGGPQLASPTLLPVATAFAQTLVATDGDGGPAPGQANHWDLDDDFSVDDGYDDQFDGALVLDVDVGGTVVSFPSDQTYAELTAFGPDLDAGDGVRAVSFTTDSDFVQTGTTSAALHPVPNARLRQTLNLTAAVAPIALTWTGSDNAGDQDFSDEPFFFQVVVRDGAGALLATVYRKDQTATTGTFGTGDLSAFAGQTVVLSFEQASTNDDSTVVDDVSVLDSTPSQFVTNGTFEAGGSGWNVPAMEAAQNVTSGVRTLNGLEVQRSFFTQPNQLWARMTDEFFNPTGSAIVATVTYRTDLGSDNSGIIYVTPGTSNKSLTSWDGSNSDRDVGIVHGTVDAVTFTSDNGLGNGNGSEDITSSIGITVPAGGRVTLVNFLIMTGTDTADTAVNITATADQVDAQARDIAKKFRGKAIYRRGMTQQQISSLLNF